MKVTKPYFSHDISAKQDEKIIRMMYDFKKSQNELISHAVYGIYWEIVEYLHGNNLSVNEIEMLADTLRVERKILEKILNDYDLFKIVDGKYISERVLRNLQQQEEKSEKARAKAAKRWNKKGENTGPEEIAQATDEELVNSIIQVYNNEFKKSQIVSEVNKEKIFKIHTENKLTLDVWQKVFSNAKRGWDIKGENKKPNLKNILDNWDAFASDDYYLAPDYEAMEAEKQAQKEAEEKAKEDARIQAQKEQARIEKEKDAICDKASAIKFLNKYNRVPEKLLKVSNIAKEYMTKYGFSIEDVLKARDET